MIFTNDEGRNLPRVSLGIGLSCAVTHEKGTPRGEPDDRNVSTSALFDLIKVLQR